MTCGQTLKDSTSLPTFSTAESPVSINVHLQLQLVGDNFFHTKTEAVWFLRRRSSKKGGVVYHTPPVVRTFMEDSEATRKQEIEGMLAIRNSAIQQRDDQSLGSPRLPPRRPRQPVERCTFHRF